MNRLFFEQEALSRGYTTLAGMDEAGRGPLAGPVVAACVIMPLDHIIPGVDDSKKLSGKKRAELLIHIRKEAIAIGVGIVEPEEIDAINILQATRKAMVKAFYDMGVLPDWLLTDAMPVLDVPVPVQGIIGGDGLSYLIGAASIVAKETRDALMLETDRLYPDYGFARHKGYGTPEHIEMLRSLGPCPLHRRTFLRKVIP